MFQRDFQGFFFVLLMIKSFNTTDKLWEQSPSNTIYIGVGNLTPCSINVFETYVESNGFQKSLKFILKLSSTAFSACLYGRQM